VESTKMVEIEGAVRERRGDELEVGVEVRVKAVRAEDYERGSRKLAVP